MRIFHLSSTHSSILSSLFAIGFLQFFSLLSAEASNLDSLKAKSFFNLSWKFPLYSEGHQKMLDSALKYDPKNAYYWQQKSMPLHKMGQHEAAAPFLDSAVKLNPSRWLAYRGFMHCIFEKHYRAALSDFSQAEKEYLGQYIMDHPYSFYQGICHLQLRQTDSACYFLDKTISEEKNRLGDGNAHYNSLFYRAMVEYQMENYREALPFLNDCLKQYPNFSDALFYKCLCLLRSNQKENIDGLIEFAENAFKQKMSLNEDNILYVEYPFQIRFWYFNILKEERKL